jgi:hypothetical protein
MMPSCRHSEPNRSPAITVLKGISSEGEEAMKRTILVMTALLFAGPALAQDAVIVEVPQPARDYVIAHPSDPVVVEGDLAVGTAIPEGVELVPIPDTPEYSYVYVDKRPVIVSTKERKVVYLSE